MHFSWLFRPTIFGLLLVLSLPAMAESAAEVITRNRAAVGGNAGTKTVVLSYIYKGQGLTGNVVTEFDTQTGAFVTASDLGTISFANGFDSVTPWMRDMSGANTSQEGGDRVRLAINEAYRNANLWWRKDFGGAKVEYIAFEIENETPFHRLAVTPAGGGRFEAWFEARSGHLKRIAERQMFFDTRVFYDEYKKLGGRFVATKLVVDGGTGDASYATMKLNSLSLRPSRPLKSFARPQIDPIGVTIDGNRSSATIPFRLLNNHIYVDTLVNGKGPYTFIVDTGGHTIISTRIVAELDLSASGQTPSAGAGEKTRTSGYAQVKEFAVGPIRMSDQPAIVLDIYDPAVEGIRVDGMLGFELIRRLAMETDYGNNTLTFTRFSDFDASAAGIAIPFKFYDHLPQVEGRIAGLGARFIIDNGSRNELDLTSPFVKNHDLDARFPNSITAMTGWGSGGPSMSNVTRVPSLTLGSVTVANPVVGLSRAKAGSFSDSNYDGNVGSGLLKRFVTTFDYSRQMMYLKPIVPIPPDVGTFDRSGMWMNAGDEGYVVVYISPGGAAEAAGIQKADIITHIDGKAAESADLSATRAMLRTRPSGSAVVLSVSRAGKTRTVKLVLKDSL